MKKVVNTESVAHIWANQQQPEARNKQGNFYFINEVIYSYGSHFPICAIKEINGIKYYFMTTRKYSNTTTGHINSVLWAIPDRSNIIYVYRVPVYGFNSAENIEEAIRRILELKKKALKARTNKDYYNNEATAEIFNLRRFCALTETDFPEMLDEDKDFNIYDYIKKEVDKETARKKAQKEANKERTLKEIEAFRNGKICSIYGLPYDLLRLNGQFVETSRSVQVDKRFVKILWCMLNSGQDIVGRHCGNYTIKEVTDKFIKVGCHTFERSEVLNLINKME